MARMAAGASDGLETQLRACLESSAQAPVATLGNDAADENAPPDEAPAKPQVRHCQWLLGHAYLRALPCLLACAAVCALAEARGTRQLFALSMNFASWSAGERFPTCTRFWQQNDLMQSIDVSLTLPLRTQEPAPGPLSAVHCDHIGGTFGNNALLCDVRYTCPSGTAALASDSNLMCDLQQNKFQNISVAPGMQASAPAGTLQAASELLCGRLHGHSLPARISVANLSLEVTFVWLGYP